MMRCTCKGRSTCMEGSLHRMSGVAAPPGPALLFGTVVFSTRTFSQYSAWPKASSSVVVFTSSRVAATNMVKQLSFAYCQPGSGRHRRRGAHLTKCRRLLSSSSCACAASCSKSSIRSCTYSPRCCSSRKPLPIILFSAADFACSTCHHQVCASSG